MRLVIALGGIIVLILVGYAAPGAPMAAVPTAGVSPTRALPLRTPPIMWRGGDAARPVPAPVGTVLPIEPSGLIEPAPGWHVRGQARRVFLTPPRRHPTFQVEVSALEREVARPTGGPNLIWHVGAGRCQAGATGSAIVWDQIFYRLTPPATSPGRQAFTVPITTEWADIWRGAPLVLAAYVNGGGPFVACANLPS